MSPPSHARALPELRVAFGKLGQLALVAHLVGRPAQQDSSLPRQRPYIHAGFAQSVTWGLVGARPTAPRRNTEPAPGMKQNRRGSWQVLHTRPSGPLAPLGTWASSSCCLLCEGSLSTGTWAGRIWPCSTSLARRLLHDTHDSPSLHTTSHDVAAAAHVAGVVDVDQAGALVAVQPARPAWQRHCCILPCASRHQSSSRRWLAQILEKRFPCSACCRCAPRRRHELKRCSSGMLAVVPTVVYESSRRDPVRPPMFQTGLRSNAICELPSRLSMASARNSRPGFMMLFGVKRVPDDLHEGV